MVLDRLLGVDVAEAHDRPDRHDARVDVVLVYHASAGEALLELRDLVLAHGLLVLRVVVLRVLGDVAELASRADPVGDLPAPVGPKRLQLLLEGLIALGGEDHVLQRKDLRGLSPTTRTRRSLRHADAHGSP